MLVIHVFKVKKILEEPHKQGGKFKSHSRLIFGFENVSALIRKVSELRKPYSHLLKAVLSKISNVNDKTLTLKTN